MFNVYATVQKIIAKVNILNIISGIEESAVTEEVFKEMNPYQQRKYLKEHPTSKFHNIKVKPIKKGKEVPNKEKINNLKEEIEYLQEKLDSTAPNRKQVRNDLQKQIDKHKDRIKLLKNEKSVTPTIKVKKNSLNPELKDIKYHKSMKPFKDMERELNIDLTKLGPTGSKIRQEYERLRHPAYRDNWMRDGDMRYNKKSLEEEMNKRDKAAQKLLKALKGKTLKKSELSKRELFLVERAKEYVEDMKAYKEYQKREKTPENEKANKLGMKLRKLSDDYRSTISSWLFAKDKDPKSKETKELGAKVGELKQELAKKKQQYDKFVEKNSDKVNTGMVVVRPIFGVHKNIIPIYKSDEDIKREAEERKGSYTKTNRYKK